MLQREHPKPFPLACWLKFHRCLVTCDDWKGFGDTSGAEVNRRPRLEGSEMKAGERSRSVMVLVDRMELALTDSGRSITKKYEGISAKNPNASGKKMEGREAGREGGTCS